MVTFTREEIQIAQQAFSTPINPLDPNAAQYSQLLRGILEKMVSTLAQKDPATIEPSNDEEKQTDPRNHFKVNVATS